MKATIAVFLLSIAATTAAAGPLHEAVRSGDLAQARALIDAGSALNEQGDDGETPLNSAILSGHEPLAFLLIDRGADIHARNRGGFTPLHAAAYTNAAAVAERLIEMGAVVNDRMNNAGVAPLNVASEEGHAEVAKLLIDRGAEVEASDRNGYTALTRAIWRGHDKLVAILQAAGAKCQSAGILDEPAYSQCMQGQL